MQLPRKASHNRIGSAYLFGNKARFQRKEYCSAVLRDIAQAFDRVQHKGLSYKIKRLLPEKKYDIFKSYIEGRSFQLKYRSFTSKYYSIEVGAPKNAYQDYYCIGNMFPTCQLTVTCLYLFLRTTRRSLVLNETLRKPPDPWNSIMVWRIRKNQSRSCHVIFTLNQNSRRPFR